MIRSKVSFQIFFVYFHFGNHCLIPDWIKRQSDPSYLAQVESEQAIQRVVCRKAGHSAKNLPETLE